MHKPGCWWHSVMQWRTGTLITALCMYIGIIREKQPCFTILDAIYSRFSFNFGIDRIFNPRVVVLMDQQITVLLVFCTTWNPKDCLFQRPSLHQSVTQTIQGQILDWAWERKRLKLYQFFRGTKLKGKNSILSSCPENYVLKDVIHPSSVTFWVATISV